MRSVLFMICLFLCTLGQGSAEERIALIVGNGAYGSLGVLKNPTSDADLIATALNEVGFKVTLLQDASQTEMKRAIADFGRNLRRAGPDAVGLFYFAGHGVQSNGRNFLIPVGSNIRDEADLDVFTVDADWVLGQMASNQGGTSIIVLDACRNNPFESQFRSADRGLARMRAPNGSFVAYATAPGDVAMDGRGRNSPYSSALAAAIRQPGLPIEKVFKDVRIDVLDETRGAQTPWDSSSLTREFVFQNAAPRPIETGPDEQETALWTKVRDTNDPDQLSIYLSLYPEGAFAAEARNRREAANAAQRAAAQARATSQAQAQAQAVTEARIEAQRQQRLRDAENAQIAALTPTAPVQPLATGPTAEPDGDSVRIKLAIEYYGGGNNCSVSKGLAPVTVSLAEGAPPATIQANDSFIHSVQGHRRGQAVELKIVFNGGNGSSNDPIEILLDDPTPGASATEHTRVRAIEVPKSCKRLVAYVDVVR